MQLEEELVVRMCQEVARNMPEELKSLGRKPEQIANVKGPFPRVTYDKAVELVQESMPKFEWGKDMGYEEEKVLTQYFQLPFFVNRFPKGIKAFYHIPDPQNPKVTLSVVPPGAGRLWRDYGRRPTHPRPATTTRTNQRRTLEG